MITKNGKETQSSESGHALMDGRVAYVPDPGRTPDERSWLASTLSPDEETRTCQGRSMASEVFLQTRLFPLVEDGVRIEEAMLVDLLVDFKRTRLDLDAQLEISQVMGNLLNRFTCHLIDEAETPSDSLERELELFASLADLDFRRIDEAVRVRLNSG